MKKAIYNEIKKRLEASLLMYSQAKLDAQLSAQNETKSSAGDKYETSRSMSQIEIGMQQSQQQKVSYDLLVMEQIEKLKCKKIVSEGCLIKTNVGYYFIAISFGKINIENTEVIVLSANTPFAKMMMNKKVGEGFVFNNLEYVIESIE